MHDSVSIIITPLDYEGFTINYIATCNNIQFIFIVWPSIHSHTQCTQSTHPFTFIHTLIHIHNHTQGKCFEYWIFIIQADFIKKTETE